MATKPSSFPDWATTLSTDPTSGEDNRVEPPSSKKETGWNRREIPPRQWFNWNQYNNSLWFRWLDQREGELQSDIDDADAAINDLTESQQVELLGDFDASQWATFSRSGEVIAVYLDAGTDGLVSFASSSNPTSASGVVPNFARPPEGRDARIVYALDITSNFLYEAKVTHDGNFSLQIGEVVSGLTDTNATSAPVPNFSYKILKPIATP